MRIRVRSLTLLSDLRIHCCCELWSQTRLQSCVAVAVAQAGSCSSDFTLAWEPPYATSAALKRPKKKSVNLPTELCVHVINTFNKKVVLKKVTPFSSHYFNYKSALKGLFSPKARWKSQTFAIDFSYHSQIVKSLIIPYHQNPLSFQ